MQDLADALKDGWMNGQTMSLIELLFAATNIIFDNVNVFSTFLVRIKAQQFKAILDKL